LAKKYYFANPHSAGQKALQAKTEQFPAAFSQTILTEYLWRCG
jgi:hypothetical protein